MDALLAFTRVVDRISWVFGLIATWSVLVVTLLVAGDALVSYGITWLDSADRWLTSVGLDVSYLLAWYRLNSNSVTDASLVLFGVIVLLGAPWTLKVNEHVRVDLVYASVSDRARVWIDLLGGLIFLLPMCVILIALTWPWFLQAWTSNEMSINAGGLPRWPAKFLLPLGFALLALQGVSEIIKCIACLTRGYVRVHAYEKPVQ